MPKEVKSKRARAAEAMKKSFSEPFLEKLERSLSNIMGKGKKDEEVGKGGRRPRGAKDFLSKSLQKRRGR